jgi:hypothetical protein
LIAALNWLRKSAAPAPPSGVEDVPTAVPAALGAADAAGNTKADEISGIWDSLLTDR